VVLTAAVATAENLPIRDPDGIAGSPLVRLSIILVLFWCLDVLPRAAARSGWHLGRFGTHIAGVARERWSRRRLGLVLLGLFSFYACYVGYRNLKGFLPFVRPELHDGSLLHLEERVFGTDPSVLLRDLLGTGTAAHVLSVIYVSYLAFVPLSLGAALVWSSDVRRGLWYATALNLNWLLGVASYYLVPTLGPVYATPERYAGLPDTAAGALQMSLLEGRREVLSLGPHSTDALQSIAGFASLHVSVVVSAVLLIQIARAPRVLRVVAWAYLVLIALSTMYLGWHYAVDDVGGILIGLLSFWLAGIATGHDVGGLWRSARERAAAKRARRRARPARHPVLEGAVNVPNGLSLARILIVPVLVAIIVASPDGSLLACGLFAAGALTDVLDGHIARSRGLITPLGKLFDPLADKLLVVGALVALVIADRLPWWVVAVIVGREVMVTFMRSSAARRGRILPADGLGKLKMGLQVAMVLVLLAVPDPQAAPVTVLVAATVAATVISGGRYALRWRRLAAADQSIADQTK